MSITINTTGNNSRQIVVSDEYHPAESGGLIDKVTTALIPLGWTLFDTVTSGALNCFVTKVYTAPCNDSPSPTTKYMILRYDCPKQFMYMSCAESWNDTTHVATNECFTQYRSFPIAISTSNYILQIFATQRYCIFQPLIRGEPGIWQGIFEFERLAPDDSTGAPCFGYTNGVIFGSPFYCATPWTGNASNVNDTGVNPRNHVLPFWVPRLPTGETGLSAAKNSSLSLRGVSYPPFSPAFPFNSLTYATGLSNTIMTQMGTGIHSLSVYNSGYKQSNNYVTQKVVANPVLASQTSNTYFYGRIYGINLIPPHGQHLDTLLFPVDSNGFFSNTGSNTKHYVLGLTGGNENSLGIGMGKLEYDFIEHDPSSNTHYFQDAVIVRSRYIYATIGNGGDGSYSVVRKFDLDNNRWSNINLPGPGDSILYDGGNNIYVSTSLGITRINVDNNAIIANLNMASNLAGGAAALAIDDKYVYATQNTWSTTNNQLAVVNSSFVVERYINGINNANGTYSTHYSIVFSPNYANNRVVLIPCQMSGPQTNAAMYIVSGANGAFLVNNNINITAFSTSSGTLPTNTPYFYDSDYIELTYVPSPNYVQATSGNYGNIFHLRTSNLQVISTNTCYTLSQTGSPFNFSLSGEYPYRPFRMKEAIPFKGYRLTNAHRGSPANSSMEGFMKNLFDHDNETTLYTHFVSNTFACTFPHPAGCAFTDGIFYYRFFYNGANNMTRVYGQMKTKNNLGNNTPVILIKS